MYRALILLFCVSLVSCTAATRSGPTTRSDRISREEIDASDAQDAYELIQRLRPRWLMVRGSRSMTNSTGILVFMNNTRMGGIDALRQISVRGIGSIRYLDAAQAVAELPGIGSGPIEGAIVISSR